MAESKKEDGNAIHEMDDDEFDKLVDDAIDESDAVDTGDDDDTSESDDSSEGAQDDPGSDDDDDSVTDDDESDDDSTDGADAGEDGDDEGTATVADPANPAKPEGPASEQPATPFSYRADKGTHTLSASKLNEDGSVTIAKDGLNQLQQLLADAHAHRGSWPKQSRTLKAAVTAAEEERNAALDLVGDLGKMTDEERVEWAMGFSAKLPQLKLDIERKALERERAQLNEEREGTPEEQRERSMGVVKTEVEGELTRLFAHPSAKYLTDDDKKGLSERAMRRAATYIRRATAEDAQKLGVAVGSAIFDSTELSDDYAAIARARYDAAEAAKSGKGVRDKNAKLNADLKPKNKLPPTVESAQLSGEQKKKKIDQPLSGRDFRKAFMAGELDDDE